MEIDTNISARRRGRRSASEEAEEGAEEGTKKKKQRRKWAANYRDQTTGNVNQSSGAETCSFLRL